MLAGIEEADRSCQDILEALGDLGYPEEVEQLGQGVRSSTGGAPGLPAGGRPPAVLPGSGGWP